MEPLLFIAVLAAVAVLVATVSAAVLTRRDARPRPTSPTIMVEAPDDMHVYVVLDSEVILQLYRQTPGAAVQREVEEERETDVRATPSIGGIGVEGGRKRRTRQKTVFTPTSDPVQAVGAVERRLQSTERLRSFDLTAPSDNGPIENLLEGLGSDAGRIGLQVPGEVKESLRRAWREHRQRIPDDLESLGSYVRLRADFTVAPGAADGDRVFTAESQHDSGRLQVRVDCPAAHVLASFRRADGTITATCLGIPEWDGHRRVLTVQPLSIHHS